MQLTNQSSLTKFKYAFILTKHEKTKKLISCFVSEIVYPNITLKKMREFSFTDDIQHDFIFNHVYLQLDYD